MSAHSSKKMNKNQLLLSPDGDSAGSLPEATQPAKPAKPAKAPAKGKAPAKPAAKPTKAPAKPAAKAPAKPVAKGKAPVTAKPAAKASKPEKEPVTYQKQNGQTRPKGGKTLVPWEVADKLSAKQGSPAKRADVLARCAELGVAGGTAASQYGRWRRFHGISGRAGE